MNQTFSRFDFRSKSSSSLTIGVEIFEWWGKRFIKRENTSISARGGTYV
jgi:hypothetical protein